MNSYPRNLYLIPSLLGETPAEMVLPSVNLEIIRSLRHFIVEEEKTARRFLIRCGYNRSLDSVIFYILNEHTPVQDIPVFFSLSAESHLGLLSEAGLPAVADPGSALVEEAHRLGIKVIPLVGPSSIFMALMASGLNGQNFTFHGYLPVKNPARENRIRQIEKRSELENQSQIFIEAPYRNNQLVSALLNVCKPGTRLCMAANITLHEEWIRMKSIRDWQKSPPPDLKRQPMVFILQA
jgi:16S rRNA (cytidine1402-2'-O)-methyltransferase